MPSEWAKQKARETLGRIERSPDAGDYHHDAEAWAEALDEARAAGRREALKQAWNDVGCALAFDTAAVRTRALRAIHALMQEER